MTDKVTKLEVEQWLGGSGNLSLQECIEIITDVANKKVTSTITITIITPSYKINNTQLSFNNYNNNGSHRPTTSKRCYMMENIFRTSSVSREHRC